jgi:hypothetical protein
MSSEGPRAPRGLAIHRQELGVLQLSERSALLGELMGPRRVHASNRTTRREELLGAPPERIARVSVTESPDARWSARLPRAGILT